MRVNYIEMQNRYHMLACNITSRMTYLTRIMLQVIIVGEGEGGVIGVTPPFPPLNMKKNK